MTTDKLPEDIFSKNHKNVSFKSPNLCPTHEVGSY